MREREHELAFTVGGIERRRGARDERSADQQADVTAHGAERVVDILVHVCSPPGYEARVAGADDEPELDTDWVTDEPLR